ncbi:unnamed protein product, partial [Acidithrix sp. C25]
VCATGLCDWAFAIGKLGNPAISKCPSPIADCRQIAIRLLAT